MESISHFKSTSNHSDHNIPPSANQTLGGVWPLLPLAWQVARPSPKLHDWKWEAQLRNIMKHICVCYYRHDISCIMYIHIYIYICTQQKYCNLFAFESACFNTQSARPPQNLATNTLKQHTLTPLKTQTPPNHGISGLQIYSLQWAIQDLKIGSCL